jgi:hypothetical protein
MARLLLLLISTAHPLGAEDSSEKVPAGGAQSYTMIHLILAAALLVRSRPLLQQVLRAIL